MDWGAEAHFYGAVYCVVDGGEEDAVLAIHGHHIGNCLVEIADLELTGRRLAAQVRNVLGRPSCDEFGVDFKAGDIPFDVRLTESTVPITHSRSIESACRFTSSGALLPVDA